MIFTYQQLVVRRRPFEALLTASRSCLTLYFSTIKLLCQSLADSRFASFKKLFDLQQKQFLVANFEGQPSL